MTKQTITTGIFIKPPKGMTMRDLHQLAAKFDCIARQIKPGIIDMTQPMLIKRPLRSCMVANVPNAMRNRDKQ